MKACALLFTFVLWAAACPFTRAAALPPQTRAADLEAQEHFRAALQAQNSGRLDAAAREYEEVIQLQPQLAEAYANLGLVYYLQSKFEKSSQALAKAAALKPGLRGADLFLGIDDVRLYRPKEAVPLLIHAVEEEPKNKQAQLWLGTALWNAGQRAEALQRLRKAAEIFPTDVDILYALGEAYQKSANHQLEMLPLDDVRLLQKGITPPQWVARTSASEVRNSSSGARGQAAHLKDTGSRYLPYKQAMADFNRKDYRAAQAKLTVFLAANPENAEARYLLARTYEQLSLTVLSRMFQVDPNSYRVHQLLGRIDEDRWQNDKALAEYKTVEQMRPALPGLHLAIGEVLWREGRLEPALAEFEAEIKLSPYDSRPYAEAGTILVKQHESAEAIPDLTKALQLQPDQLLLHKQIGTAYYQQKKYAQAEQELEKALPIDHDGSVHFLLGAVYRDSGHPRKAKTEMEEARLIQTQSERRAEATVENAASANQ